MDKLILYKQGGFEWIPESGTCYTANTIVDRIENGVTYSKADTDIVEVIEGVDAYVRYYKIRFEALEDWVKEIVLSVFPNLFMKLEQGDELKDPNVLYNLSINKMAKEQDKFLRKCTRCGGSGHHSYNQIDGTVCFKCGGVKYILPSKSKMNTKWLESIKNYYK